MWKSVLKFHLGCTEGDLRLTGGEVKNEGDLEVCLFDVWGSVCDVNWSETDSKVACRQLGFTTGNISPLALSDNR